MGRPNLQVTKVCLICGLEFKVTRHRAIHGEGLYCSRKCYGESLHNKIELICPECGKVFYRHPAAVKRGQGKFCSNSCSMKSRVRNGYLKHILSQSPNRAEQIIIDLVARNNLPFRYSGNGDVWLGNRNPDFINTNGKKQVIELLGIYWHPLFDGAQRKEHYKQYGFDCLIIWEDELNNKARISKKLKEFGLDRI